MRRRRAAAAEEKGKSRRSFKIPLFGGMTVAMGVGSTYARLAPSGPGPGVSASSLGSASTGSGAEQPGNKVRSALGPTTLSLMHIAFPVSSPVSCPVFFKALSGPAPQDDS